MERHMHKGVGNEIIPRAKKVQSVQQRAHSFRFFLAFAFIAAFLYQAYFVFFVEAIGDTFSQTAWSQIDTTATGIASYPANKTGWVKYAMSSRLTAGAELQLSKITGPQGDDTQDRSTGHFNDPTAVKTNTMTVNTNTADSTDADITLNRAGDANGIVEINIKGGSASGIVRDANNNLHVVFHDAQAKTLKYAFSSDSGSTWSAVSTLTPAISLWPGENSPTDLGSFIDLTINTNITAKRLYVVARAEKRDTTPHYSALVFGYCSYATTGKCESGSWTWKIVDSYDNQSRTSTMDGLYRYPAIAVTTVTTGYPFELLHIAFSKTSGFTYYNCEPTGSNAYCTSPSLTTWTNKADSDQFGASNRFLVHPSRGHRIKLLNFNAGTSDIIKLYECDASTPSNCKTGTLSSKWPHYTVNVDENLNETPDPGRYVDGAVDANGTVHVVYDAKGAKLNYRTKAASATSFSVYSTLTYNISSTVAKPVRMKLDSNNKPRIAYSSGDGKLAVTSYDTGSWKTKLLESGGHGVGIELLQNDVPAVTYFTNTTSNGKFKYAQTLYAQEGTFTSRWLDAGGRAVWKNVDIYLKPPESTIGSVGSTEPDALEVYVKSEGQSFCKFGSADAINPSSMPTGNKISFANGGTTGCTISAGVQKVQYQLKLRSNSLRTATPIIDKVSLSYERYEKDGMLLSSPYYFVPGEQYPVIRNISWDETFSSGSNAVIKVDLRVFDGTPLSFSDPASGPSWYGVGPEPFVTSASSAPCQRADTGAVKTVSCDIPMNSPLNTAQWSHFQYRIQMEVSDGASTPKVNEVRVSYATNNPPTVSVTSATQNSNGVSVNYNLSDPDSEDTMFNIALFYDVGLRLGSDLTEGGDTITLNLPSGTTDLSSLIHGEGAVLVDKEQIKYYRASGNFLGGYLSIDKPMARGAYNTSRSSHSTKDSNGVPREVVVWVRATDNVVASDFGRTARATGEVGDDKQYGNGKLITWIAALDMKAKVYRENLPSILVLANDKKLVKQVGVGISSAFTLDTKPPQLSGKFSVQNPDKFIDGRGYKMKSNQATLLLPAIDSTGDNLTSEDKMYFCLGSNSSSECGNPSGVDLLGGANASWRPTGGANVSSSYALQISTTPKPIYFAVVDSVGNAAFQDSTPLVIMQDATSPIAPTNFNAEDITASRINGQPSVWLSWSWNGQTDQGGMPDFEKFVIYRDKYIDAGTSLCIGTGSAPIEGFCERASVSSSVSNGTLDDQVQLGQTYTYKIVAVDNVGNQSHVLSDPTIPTKVVSVSSSGGSTAQPQIVDVSVVTPSVTEGENTVITWKTIDTSDSGNPSNPWPADSRIAYVLSQSMPADFSNASTQGKNDLVSSHTVQLVGLRAGHYFFEVRSSSGNISAPPKSESTLYFDVLPRVTIKPDFSMPTVNAGPTSATISWRTSKGGADLSATSYVDYGLEASGLLTNVAGKLESIAFHSVLITGLEPSTNTTPKRYIYRVRSKPSGDNGEEGWYPETSYLSFPTDVLDVTNDTSPPQIIRLDEGNLGRGQVFQNTAKICWETVNESNQPELTNSHILFWEDGTTNYRTTLPDEFSSNVSNPCIQLPADLKAGTKYQYKAISLDLAGNQAEASDDFTTSPPMQLPDPVISDVRSDPSTPNSVTFYWKTSNVDSNSIVYFSEQEGAFNEADSKINPLLTKDEHLVRVVGLKSGTAYYFKFVSVNSQGGKAESTACNGETPCTVTTKQSTDVPLIISNINVESTEKSATITWDTNRQSTSFIEYGSEFTYGRIFGNRVPVSSVPGHSITLTDLVSNTKYHFRVISEDSENGQVAQHPLNNPSVQTESADVDCSKPPPDKYNLCGDPTFETNPSNYDLVKETNQPLIITMNKDQNGSVVPLLVSDVSAVIGWKTNRSSDSIVYFGLTPLLESSSTIATLTKEHAIQLANLTPGQQYYFKAASVDFAGFRAEDPASGDPYTFTTNEGISAYRAGGAGYTQPPCPGCIPPEDIDTTPPAISNVEVKDITDSSATITWDTNEQSTSIVSYGETDDYGTIAGSYSELVVNHEVELRSLNSGTEHHFQVISVDGSGNIAEGADLTFTTLGTKREEEPEEETEEIEQQQLDKKIIEEAFEKLSSEAKSAVDKMIELLKDFSEEDVTTILNQLGLRLISPPEFVGGEPKVEVTQTTATISWQTDRPSDSRVAYATSEEFKSGDYASEIGEADSYVTEHIVMLVDLKPGTTYHYQLRSREMAGRSARSSDRAFRTLTLRPEITSIKIKEKTEHTAVLTWKTNVPTKSIIEYANTKTGAKKSQGDPQFITKHQFTLTELDQDTLYRATIRAEDEDGIAGTSTVFSITTAKDDKLPAVSQVRAELSLMPGKKNIVQAVISWKTDELSDSQVFYDEGLSKETALAQSTLLQVDLSMSHVAVLSKLNAATIYRFRVVSRDAAGNTGTSKEFKIITPKKEETVLELIIKNFEETFGFLRRER